MALIVGLGNPGLEYKGTRHNVGFELIDILSKKLTITLEKGNGLFFMGTGQFKSRSVALLKPTTYMNRSGKAVSKALAVTGDSLSGCMICYDDITWSPGESGSGLQAAQGGIMVLVILSASFNQKKFHASESVLEMIL